jgi:hypothetical protein
MQAQARSNCVRRQPRKQAIETRKREGVAPKPKRLERKAKPRHRDYVDARPDAILGAAFYLSQTTASHSQLSVLMGAIDRLFNKLQLSDMERLAAAAIMVSARRLTDNVDGFIQLTEDTVYSLYGRRLAHCPSLSPDGKLYGTLLQRTVEIYNNRHKLGNH